MSPQIKCPTCGTSLKSILREHIESKNHQNALENEGIAPSEDPALEMLEIMEEIKHEDSSLEDEANYETKEMEDLIIPCVPEPPKQETTKLDSSNFFIDISSSSKPIEDDLIGILVNCDRCNGVISVPVPSDLTVKYPHLPVIPITYVHKNKENFDPHCITLYLDQHFDIRRQRSSDVVLPRDIFE